jgi:hypothetical protein
VIEGKIPRRPATYGGGTIAIRSRGRAPMVKGSGRDFVICYYCPNEATQTITVERNREVLRRWVCSHHATLRPVKRRHWWRRAMPVR